MKQILLTGATGFIGQELRPLLLQNGYYLTIVTRSPQKYADEAAKNQRFISWDDDLIVAMNNAEAVIHLAGEGIFDQRWTDEVKRRIYDSRIKSTNKLVEAMRLSDSPPKLFISASASGIYGDRGDQILDEDGEIAEGDFLADVCKAWEDASLKAEDIGVRVVNPRIGIVFEKGGGALGKMLPPFQFFIGGPVGNGTQYMSWIHRTDLCRALMYPLTNDAIQGAYNVCSPEPVDMNTFASKLGSVMNRPSVFRVPEFALQLAFGEAAKAITDSIRMQPKVLQVSGFEFKFEMLEEALADIIWD